MRSGHLGLLGLLICAGPVVGAQAPTWRRHISAEFPAAVAAFQRDRNAYASSRLQFYGGYGVELGLERRLRPGLTLGTSLLAMGGLTAGACESDLVSYDSCDAPLGRAIGTFVGLRQQVPRSNDGAQVAATVGIGAYHFDGSYLGRHISVLGPALQYAAEAESGKIRRISFLFAARGQLIIDPTSSPVQVNTLNLGFRAR